MNYYHNPHNEPQWYCAKHFKEKMRRHWLYHLLTCILVAAGIAIFYFLCTGIGEYIARKL